MFLGFFFFARKGQSVLTSVHLKMINEVTGLYLWILRKKNESNTFIENRVFSTGENFEDAP